MTATAATEKKDNDCRRKQQSKRKMRGRLTEEIVESEANKRGIQFAKVREIIDRGKGMEGKKERREREEERGKNREEERKRAREE